VADDILDATQTSEVLGKTAGKDEAVDKTTYVKLLGLEGAKAGQCCHLVLFFVFL